MNQPHLYRARYKKPSGDIGHVTFASLPHDATRWATDYVRFCISPSGRHNKGELLEVIEQRPLVLQLQLV